MEEFYKLPTEDVNDEDAVIVEIPLKSGKKIKKGDFLYSFETTKALVEVTAEHDGYVFYLVEVSDNIKVGSDVCVISSDKKFDLVKTKKKIDSATKSTKYTLTKKAQDFVDKNKIDISSYDLSGVIRIKQLKELIDGAQTSTSIRKKGRVLLINIKDNFIDQLLKEENIKYLPSEEKIALYKKNGHSIGENVFIGSGTIIISNSINIKDNVTIGSNTYMEVPEIEILENTKIGSSCNIVASKMLLGPYNRLVDNAKIDLSGGRNFDSNLITGRGCLMSSYINVCREVRLGENVALSPDSIVFTHSYWQSVLEGYPVSYGPVEFEDDTWLGAGSYVLPNVNVGKGSVIMSASLVANNVNPYTMVGGTPASLVKENLKKEKTEEQVNNQLSTLFTELSFWFYSNHYEVVSENENIFTIILENREQKKCGLIIGNTMEKDQFNDCDILISFDSIKEKFSETKFLINIKDKELIGDASEIENLIVEFFRHQGIRLYHL